MGIDGFSFESQVRGNVEKRYGTAPSNLCPCGRDMADHTLREKRACNDEQ